LGPNLPSLTLNGPQNDVRRTLVPVSARQSTQSGPDVPTQPGRFEGYLMALDADGSQAGQIGGQIGGKTLGQTGNQPAQAREPGMTLPSTNAFEVPTLETNAIESGPADAVLPGVPDLPGITGVQGQANFDLTSGDPLSSIEGGVPVPGLQAPTDQRVGLMNGASDLALGVAGPAEAATAPIRAAAQSQPLAPQTDQLAGQSVLAPTVAQAMAQPGIVQPGMAQDAALLAPAILPAAVLGGAGQRPAASAQTLPSPTGLDQAGLEESATLATANVGPKAAGAKPAALMGSAANQNATAANADPNAGLSAMTASGSASAQQPNNTTHQGANPGANLSQAALPPIALSSAPPPVSAATALPGDMAMVGAPGSTSPQAGAATSAAPSAAAPHTAGLTPKQLAAQADLSAKIFHRHSQGQSRFEVRLDPPEMGKIDVTIEIGPDNKVRAVLAAREVQTFMDLTRGARALETAMAQAGLDLAENGLSFEHKNTPFEHDQGGQEFDRASRTNDAAELAEAADVGPASTLPLLFERFSRARLNLQA
jgi:flagellar hook-length control protein FliK